MRWILRKRCDVDESVSWNERTTQRWATEAARNEKKFIELVVDGRSDTPVPLRFHGIGITGYHNASRIH